MPKVKKIDNLEPQNISKAVVENVTSLEKKIANRRKQNLNKESVDATVTIAMASENVSSPMRRNIAGDIVRTNRFSNIDEGIIPFRYGSTIYGNRKSMIDVRDTVILCQKCYYNFAIFRNIIDLMTEFSIGELYFRGGNAKSRDFFKALFNKINLWDFQDKFFREYYRSGNVFIYRFDATLQQDDIARITQVFGSEEDMQNLEVDKMQVPSRYVILNPADIHMVGTANFGFGIYYKLLTAFELAQLKNPKTEEDKLVFDSFSPEIQNQIMSGIQSVLVPLDIKKVAMIFYKKQDYEPFSIPMGYPVLEDINFKAELKKIDMAICRTMQQIVLLVTTGAEPDKGGINPKNIQALQNLFQNMSVGRVLIADYTTEAKFVIPDIGELLNPQKYEVVDKDINTGLNNVFAGDEKFANQQQKVEIFMSRLDQAKQSFLNNFLVPEIKRIAQSLGFTNYPTPHFKPGSLEDDINRSKIYARLIEMGILTPEQGLEAIQSNTLPDSDAIQSGQKAYKQQRDAGLFVPLLNQQQNQEEDSAGRPTGTKAPKTVQTVSPIGTSKASEQEEKFSLKKVTENLLLAQELEKKVTENIKSLYNIKRISKFQKEVINDTVNLVIANEAPSNWIEASVEYTKNPENKNNKQVLDINKIGEVHQLDNYLAGILFHSKKEQETSNT